MWTDHSIALKTKPYQVLWVHLSSDFSCYLLSNHTTLSVLCMCHGFLYHCGCFKRLFLLFEMFSPPPSYIHPIQSTSWLDFAFICINFLHRIMCSMKLGQYFLVLTIISQCLAQCRYLINITAWLNEQINVFYCGKIIQLKLPCPYWYLLQYYLWTSSITCKEERKLKCAISFIIVLLYQAKDFPDIYQIYQIQFLDLSEYMPSLWKRFVLASWLWHYNLELWSVMLSGPWYWFLADIS